MYLQPDDVDFRYFKLVTLFGLNQIVKAWNIKDLLHYIALCRL